MLSYYHTSQPRLAHHRSQRHYMQSLTLYVGMALLLWGNPMHATEKDLMQKNYNLDNIHSLLDAKQRKDIAIPNIEVLNFSKRKFGQITKGVSGKTPFFIRSKSKERTDPRRDLVLVMLPLDKLEIKNLNRVLGSTFSPNEKICLSVSFWFFAILGKYNQGSGPLKMGEVWDSDVRPFRVDGHTSSLDLLEGLFVLKEILQLLTIFNTPRYWPFIRSNLLRVLGFQSIAFNSEWLAANSTIKSAMEGGLIRRLFKEQSFFFFNRFLQVEYNNSRNIARYCFCEADLKGEKKQLIDRIGKHIKNEINDKTISNALTGVETRALVWLQKKIKPMNEPLPKGYKRSKIGEETYYATRTAPIGFSRDGKDMCFVFKLCKSGVCAKLPMVVKNMDRLKYIYIGVEIKDFSSKDYKVGFRSYFKEKKCRACTKTVIKDGQCCYCCNGAYYCGKKCQKHDWKQGHKEICTRRKRR